MAPGADGWILEDGTDVGETHQCCHCGAHFEIIRGSGRQRGFCMRCHAVTCGAERCYECLPFEKRLDLYEKGKLSTL